MNRLPLVLCSVLGLVACGGESPDPQNPPTRGAPAAAPPTAEAEHGDRRPLGELTCAGHTFAVIQFGEMAPGHQGAIDLEWPAGVQRPPTVRAWIGVESGEGSMKSRLAKEGDRVVHGHIEVPKTPPAGSMLWIEIEDGDRQGRASIAFR